MFLDESVIVLEQGLSAIQREFVRQKETEYPVSFWFYVSPIFPFPYYYTLPLHPVCLQ
jgi:hypothetical protein